MSARQKLKLITMFSLLLILTSCGNDKKKSTKAPKNAPVQNAVCEGIQCLSSIHWKIFLQGQTFPDKTRININGNTVLDECLGKQQYKIDRASIPQSLTLENYIVPTQGRVKIHVVDQGHDCGHEKTFIYNENASYEVVKGLLGNELQISL